MAISEQAAQARLRPLRFCAPVGGRWKARKRPAGRRSKARKSFAGKPAEGAEAATVDSADDGGGADVLREWVSCSKRAYIRNTRALGELFYYCWTPYGLLHWQSNLLNETLSDLADTNTRILRLVSRKA